MPRFRGIACVAALMAAPGAVPLPALPPGEPPGRLAFQAYGLDQGMTNLAVWCLHQDRRGLLWAGTENGLLRFDGRRFEAFSTRQGLPTSSINALLEAPDGRLWVGTTQGLAYLDRGRFRGPAEEPGLPRLYITSLALGPDQRLWVGTPEGPWVQASATGFRPAPHWPGGQVTALAGGSGLWAASWNGTRAEVLHWKNAGWEAVPATGDFGREPVDALAVDGRGTLWGRSLTRLWQLRGARFEPAPFPVARTHQKAALHVDGGGNLWIPTSAGLLLWDGGGARLLRETEGLPPNHHRVAFVDREGSLWVGGTGLFRVRGGGCWRSYGAAEGLPDLNIWCIFRDREGRLFVGSDKGLARLSAGGWAPVPGTEGMQVRSVVQAPDGALLMTGSPHLLRWDPRTDRCTRIGAESGMRSGRRTFRLGLGADGTLWVATEGEGLLRGTPTSTGWSFLPEPLPGGAPKETFEDVDLDGQGRLWAPGERGLAVLEGGLWRRFTTRDGLRRDHVTHVRSLRDGRLLVSYAGDGGLFTARYGGGRLQILEHLEGRLPGGQVFYLAAEDRRGRIWGGTGAGVFLLGPEGGQTRFTTADGLPGDDINSQAILAEPDGDVWIGTSSGLARFEARAFRGFPEPPATAILGVELGGQAHGPEDPTPLRVPRQEGHFEARFAGLSYLRDDGLEFQVRMLGLEPEWHPAHALSERFLALGAGRYTFQVRSRHPLGAWGPPAQVAFEVLPAWWQTWWAYAVYGIGLLGLYGLTHRVRVRLLHARNLELQARVAAATRDLLAREQEVEAQARDLERANAHLQALNGELQDLNTQKDSFLGIAAHDLRNPLNAIVLSAQLMEEESSPEEVLRTARYIYQEGMEMSALIGRLLEVAAIENGSLRAECSAFPLGPLVSETLDRHGPRAAEKGIALQADVVEPSPSVFADARFLKEVLDNLVSNALKFSPPGTTVTVRVEPSGSQALIAVEDQGPGIPMEDRAQLFKRFARLSPQPTGGERSTGLGLSIVKHMVEAMGGRIWVDSEPGKGSTFRVELPGA